MIISTHIASAVDMNIFRIQETHFSIIVGGCCSAA